MAAVVGPPAWGIAFSSSLLDASPCVALKADFSPPSASLLAAAENFSRLPEGSPKSIWGKLPKRLDRQSRAASVCHTSPLLAGKLLSPTAALSGGGLLSPACLLPGLAGRISSVNLDGS